MSDVGLTGSIAPLNGGNFTVFRGNIVADLTTLATYAGGVTGSQVYVTAEDEIYTLDTANAFTLSTPLIVAALGGGRWFRRSKKWVVGNFTLWVCMTAGFVANDQIVLGYTPGQLLNGAAAADISLDLNALATGDSEFINSAIVDNLGNLWVTAYHTTHTAPGVLYKFLLKDILRSGSPTPKVKITGTARATCGYQASAFDKTNALWSMIFNTGASPFTLRKLAATAYASTGTPTADVEVTINNGTGEYQDMTIDAEGNLWVSSFGTGIGNGEVVMVAAAQLQSSQVGVVPAVRWSGTNIKSPVGLCFGPTGVLWIANYNTGGAASNLSAYATQSPASGNQAPLITLTGINGIIGVAFDSDGNAWVNSQDDGKQYFLTVAQMAASGVVVPTRSVVNPAGMLPQSSTFPNNPQRSGLVASGSPIYP